MTPSSADPTEFGVLARLGRARHELTGALDQVAKTVLADPGGVSRATITDLAERVGTSPGTITRFCRALGYSGYQELKVALAEEVGRAANGRWDTDISREIHQGDSLKHVLQVLLAADTRALEQTADQLDLEAVDACVHALVDARQAHYFGIGTSGATAEELRLRLHRIGIPSWSWQDVHNGLVAAALLDRRDVAIGISDSGHVHETVEFLREARRQGATTVAMTADDQSPIAAEADIVLTTAIQATSFHSDALAARHSQLLVLDVLYARTAQLTQERTLALLESTAQAVNPHRIGKTGNTPGPGSASAKAR
jgi:DNA-binding MurR/RpiR family transcriptional regulator